jgi:hypothetical protein
MDVLFIDLNFILVKVKLTENAALKFLHRLIGKSLQSIKGLELKPHLTLRLRRFHNLFSGPSSTRSRGDWPRFSRRRSDIVEQHDRKLMVAWKKVQVAVT